MHSPSQEIPRSLIEEDIKSGNKEIRIDVQENASLWLKF